MCIFTALVKYKMSESEEDRIAFYHTQEDNVLGSLNQKEHNVIQN